MAKSTRLEWIDILKGIGILGVVIGHSGSPKAFYLFWFHMPLFFLISGFLFKERESESLLSYFYRKARHLLVPYFFYLFGLTLLSMIFSEHRGLGFWFPLQKEGINLLLGGSRLEGVYATFWFTTALLSVQFLYASISRVSSGVIRGLIILLFYFLAHFLSRNYEHVFIPGNLDVALFAIFFFWVGNVVKSKKWLEGKKASKVIIISSMLVTIVFLLGYNYKFLDFGLDLKHRQYYYFGTSIILPLALSFLLLEVSRRLQGLSYISSGLTILGRASMVIMYLHVPVNMFAKYFIDINPLTFVILGTLFPLLWYRISLQIPLISFLATGETSINRIKAKYQNFGA